MRGQRLRGLLLSGAIIPIRIVLGHYFDVWVLIKDMHRAIGMTLIDRVARHTAGQKDLTFAAQLVNERLRRVLTKPS